MRLPNAENAIIEVAKLRDYLLDIDHIDGGPKANLLLSMGFQRGQWQELEDAIRATHVLCEVVEEVETDYGMRYDVVAAITGPTGRAIEFRTIWQIDVGTDRPRLITMIPE